ncbi:MAG TPA: hypothetical protein DDY20_00030 [Desulfobulbaceae bacterium]|nr:hypothetical protein [Desulfobulbaceae bacterium]
MVNRAALLLRYNEPFLRWINTLDPSARDQDISMEEANQDSTVYLIDEEVAENLEEWIAMNYQTLFDIELEGWSMDESLWPQNRDIDLFNQWFTVECHTVLLDTGIEPIFDDEA